ncbi:MAG: hypothetical protein DWQ51_06650 [Microcystis wesenbergii TW10]|uniref:Uncharacterized protein n=2 Tax=Microcystis TaxID=1125 RepID=A0A552AI29_MICAE|nr:MAG: hypothetical protein DWQ51_06650 [Microcystis wesenbergii TW10]TRT85134.1 MAG: hypothetical protein EWV63_13845 [Microcystis aeruginosa Ma_OC_H_19870700_S124]
MPWQTKVFKYLGKINYTYLTPLLPLASCLLPIFTRKLILHDYLFLPVRYKMSNFLSNCRGI